MNELLNTNNNLISDNLNIIYERLCYLIKNYGEKVKNTTELTNVSFKLTNVDNCIITNKIKPASLKYLIAENIWYANGSNDVSFIGRFAKYWYDISDDGLTSNSAYGYIMQHKFNFNQIDLCIDMLKKDPETRRACIILNDANKNAFETKDEQCTMFIQFTIRENKLNCSVCMRSNDIIWGLPYDVPAFIAIQKYIAYKLEIECGYYYHYATSMHCYDIHYHLLKQIFMADYEENVKVDLLNIYLQASWLYYCVENFNIDKQNILDFYRRDGILKDGK